MTFIYGQVNQRIDIKGIVLSENQDVEGVTIFNTSSNRGAVTNEKGEFNIEVSLYDRIEVSALQFSPISLIINEEVINSKSIKIYLVEQVNQLDAVLLSNGLKGNIAVDIDNVKMVPGIELNMGNMNAAFEYNDDKAFNNQVVANSLNATINKGQFYNGVDFVGLATSVYSLLVKPKNKKIKEKELSLNENQKVITDVFSHEYLSKNFNIPLAKVPSFIDFLESNEISTELFKTENELQLIDYIMLQSKLYLKENDFKN
ncbi:MAG TPA: carboxypeptidase-like regulatory domain-containing protein [Yeosuana sp.]